MCVIRAHNNYAHTGLCIKLIITRDVHNILTQQFETWAWFSFILSNLLFLLLLVCFDEIIKIVHDSKIKALTVNSNHGFPYLTDLQIKIYYYSHSLLAIRFFLCQHFFSLLAVHYVSKISVMCYKQEGCLIHFHFYTIKVWLVWNLNKFLFVCFFETDSFPEIALNALVFFCVFR